MTDYRTAPAFAQLERPSLRDQARRVLRASIVTGKLVPGRLYTVGALAAELGVSATPVREALGDLVAFGLVDIVPNRGFMVVSLTEHDLDEIVRVRLLLEPPAMEQLAHSGDTGFAAQCQLFVKQGRAAAEAGDVTGFLEADRDLHLTLIAALGNRRLVDILGQLRDQTRLYGLPGLAASGSLVASAEEHEALLNAILAGDGATAKSLMIQHLKHARGVWAGRLEEPLQSWE